MDKDELLFRLASSVFEDPGLSDHDWDTASVVFVADGGAVSWYGYSYRGNDPRALDLEGDELFELLLDFQAATVSPNGSVWKTCLFQVDRDGEFEITFEHDDADRWRVTPATIDTIHEQIRMKKAQAAKEKAPTAKKKAPAAKKQASAAKKKAPAAKKKAPAAKKR